jgi:hypothetical protein
MTATDAETYGMQPRPGRLWVVRRAAPYVLPLVAGLLPRPDPLARLGMRRAAYALVTLRTWPDMAAASEQAAQLAMLRLLMLQRQTRRAVRGRHREASATLARASIETLFSGLYCLQVPGAIAELHAGNLKAVNDGLAYVEETGIVPAQVVRDCTAPLGVARRRYLGVSEMVAAIDTTNGNKQARSIYNRLYGPLSNFTVHAGGGTLMRHRGATVNDATVIQSARPRWPTRQRLRDGTRTRRSSDLGTSASCPGQPDQTGSAGGCHKPGTRPANR